VWLQLGALLHKRLLCARRELSSVLVQLLLPVGFVALALLLLTVDVSSAGPRLELTVPGWVPPTALPSELPFADDPATRLIAEALNGSQAERQAAGEAPSLVFAPVPLDGHTGLFPDVAVPLSAYLLQGSQLNATAADGGGGSAAGVGAGVGNRFGALAISPFLSPQGPLPLLTVLHNSTAPHALPTFVNLGFAGWLRWQLEALGLRAPAVDARVTLHPLPRTRSEQQLLSAVLSVFVSLFVLIPFSFVPASFVVQTVREREEGAHQQQLVSGASVFSLWLAHWLYDALTYALVECATLAVFAAMGRDEFTGSAEAVGATAAIFAAFGLAAIALVGLLSRCFRSHSAAQLAIAALFFGTGFVLVVLDFTLEAIDSTRAANRSLQACLYPLFPGYCLGHGMFRLSIRSAIAAFAPALTPGKGGKGPGGGGGGGPTGGSAAADFLSGDAHVMAWSQLGRPIAFLLVEALLFAALTLVLEARPDALERCWEGARARWRVARAGGLCGMGGAGGLGGPYAAGGGAEEEEEEKEEDDVDVAEEAERVRALICAAAPARTHQQQQREQQQQQQEQQARARDIEAAVAAPATTRPLLNPIAADGLAEGPAEAAFGGQGAAAAAVGGVAAGSAPKLAEWPLVLSRLRKVYPAEAGARPKVAVRR
jgi:hypothetical protein